MHPLSLRSAGVLPLCLLGLLLAGGRLHAQEPGALRVVVTVAETQAPLVGAVAHVVGSSHGGVTAADGTLLLTPLPAGPVRLRVQHLGYSTQEVHAIVEAARVGVLHVVLRAEPIPLAPVQVVARERRAVQMLTDNGFYRRQGFGIGTFITREQIVVRDSRTLSEVLRGVSGMAFFGRTIGSSRASFTRMRAIPNCPVQFFVDGVPAHGMNIDEVSPTDVEALELYAGSSQVPIQFKRFNSDCGVIVIWTRLD